MAPSPTDPLEVSARMVFDVVEPSTIALQVAVAQSLFRQQERLAAALDGSPVDLLEVVVDRSRIHLLTGAPGRLEVAYSARVERPRVLPMGVGLDERLVALRQSRYCPSDVLDSFAAQELGDVRGGSIDANAVAEWVFQRLLYEGGSSGPADTAIDTLLAGRGVCRDFAHLTVTLCRSLGIPARFVSVYAPGLSPMDFHAVAEVAGPDGWHVIDATRLAPRSSLVRIATGRDAADTVLASTLEGDAEMVESEVMAWVDGDLPFDDHVSPVVIAEPGRRSSSPWRAQVRRAL